MEVHGSPDSGAFSVGIDGEPVTLMATEDPTGEITLAVRGPWQPPLGGDTRNSRRRHARIPRRGTHSTLPGGGRRGHHRTRVDEGRRSDHCRRDRRPPLRDHCRRHLGAPCRGTLQYVHHYQALNQVENQVWADEMLQDRWATLNQPPGWSPLLTTATVVTGADLRAAGVLFLLVITLVGLSSVRLIQVLAPDAPRLALLVPAAMVASHGMHMLEPGSQNFPDSLYAASILAVATAIAEGRVGWIAALGIGAGAAVAGVVVGTLFLVTWWRASGKPSGVP